MPEEQHHAHSPEGSPVTQLMSNGTFVVVEHLLHWSQVPREWPLASHSHAMPRSTFHGDFLCVVFSFPCFCAALPCDGPSKFLRLRSIVVVLLFFCRLPCSASHSHAIPRSTLPLPSLVLFPSHCLFNAQTHRHMFRFCQLSPHTKSTHCDVVCVYEITRCDVM